MNWSMLALWRAWTIEITVTVNRIRANIARVIAVRNGRSTGYDIAIRAAGRPFRLPPATISALRAGAAGELPGAHTPAEAEDGPRDARDRQERAAQEEEAGVMARGLRQVSDRP